MGPKGGEGSQVMCQAGSENWKTIRDQNFSRLIFWVFFVVFLCLFLYLYMFKSFFWVYKAEMRKFLKTFLSIKIGKTFGLAF